MKIVDWLLQPTQDGATYLQAITLSIIAIVLTVAIMQEVKELFADVMQEEENGHEKV